LVKLPRPIVAVLERLGRIQALADYTKLKPDPRLLRTALGGSGLMLVAVAFWATRSAPAAVQPLHVEPVSTPPMVLPPAPEPQLPRSQPEVVASKALSPERFAEIFKDDVRAVGSLSLGLANRGYLFNAVRLEDGPYWEVVEPKYAWGTSEMVQAIGSAITEVNRLYPDSPRLFVGHLSRLHGGWLKPHRSHQSGRDVDIGYYYVDGPAWYKRATEDNLDVARTWALLSAMYKASPLEYVFIDRRLHGLLRAEAERVEEPERLIFEMFEGDPMLRPIVRHARGHDDHMHVRFMSEVSVKAGQRARAHLGKRAVRWRGTALALLKHRARKAEQREQKAAAEQAKSVKAP
jgi:penicillin-insensitive murein endopeptidase